VADIATLGIRVDADSATRALRSFGDAAESSGHKAEGLDHTVRHLAEALGLMEAVRWARETLELGARYQTLGVVMNVVGANAGKSAAEMANLQASLQKTGISMIESRNNLARMAQAHLDLADATKLARVAQDAAVIGNINSSDAFERLIHGIEAAEPMILRSIGINVGFEESYKKAAAATGRTTDALTEHERTQIRANAVIESGARIAGTYEAAMETAGKQIKSTERYLEDARVKVSEAFQPQFTAAVFAYANALKFAGDNAGTIASTLKVLAGVGEIAAVAFAGRWVASFLAARAAAVDLFLKVDTGRAVMLSSVEAQRGAAAAAVERAELQRRASAEVVAGLQAERAAIMEVQVAERQRLASAVTRVSRAVPQDQIAPLGGAVVARDNAAVVIAMRERAAAQTALTALSQQAAATDVELAAAARTLAIAEAQVTEAESARAVVMARTTLVARAATVATGAFSAAVAFLGGPIGVAIVAALALNAVLDKWIDKQMAAAQLTPEQERASQAALDHAHARAAATKQEVEAETERQRKAKELLHEREGELAKQTALNAAFGQSDSALKALEIRYDAMIQKSQDAKEHKGKELGALNAVTDALAVQKMRAEELAAARVEHDTRRDAGIATDAVLRSAEQEASLVGLTAEAVRRKRIEYDALNATTAAVAERDKALEHADANQAQLALDVYDNTLLRIKANRDLALSQQSVTDSLATDAIREQRDAYIAETAALRVGDTVRKGYQIDLDAEKDTKRAIATIIDPVLRANRVSEIELLRQAKQAHRTVTEEIEASEKASQKAVEEQRRQLQELDRLLKSTFSSFFTDIFTKGKDAFQSLWDAIKQGFIRLLADMLAASAVRRLAGAFGGALGGMLVPGVAAAQSDGPAIPYGVLGAADKAPTNYAGMAGIGLAGLGVGYGVGSSLYSSSHGDLGNYARGALGGGLSGAASGAAVGAMVGPIGAATGALIGGAAGVIGGLLGMGGASKEAAKQMAAAQAAVKLSMDALRASVRGDAVAEQTAAINADRAARKQAIEDAWAGGSANSGRVAERNRLLHEVDALENQRIANLVAEAAALKLNAADDLRVRTLRNEGHDHEADILAKQLADQREYAQAVKDRMDDAYLSQLRYNQGLEEQAVATGKATDAIKTLAAGLNEVGGYKDSGALQSRIFDLMGTGPRTAADAALAGMSALQGARDVRPSIPVSAPRVNAAPSWQPVELVVNLDGREIARVTKQHFKADVRHGGGDGDDSFWGRD
jgi:hypothetical protein